MFFKIPDVRAGGMKANAHCNFCYRFISRYKERSAHMQSVFYQILIRRFPQAGLKTAYTFCLADMGRSCNVMGRNGLAIVSVDKRNKSPDSCIVF